MFARKGYPDVLYFVKPSEDNEELKYSLRSLKNLNHGKVFIAGYKPSWVDDRYIHIATEQSEDKYENVRSSFRTALHDTRLGDDFILMNDDFFILKPTDRLPVLRRQKNIDHYIELFSKVDKDSYYVKAMCRARDLLRSWDVKTEYSYELHTPMLFNKQKIFKIIDKLPKGHRLSQLRTVYGNYYQIGGEPVNDVKVIKENQDIPFDQQFLSSSDEAFENGSVGVYLRKKFAKVLVFSHANDPDGLLSVILAQLAFAEVDYKLTNNPQADIMDYIQSVSDLSKYDYVIISDIYPGRPVLEAIPQVHWFDHTQHSIDKITEHELVLPNATVVTEIDGRPTSGSELLYRWLKQEGLLGDEPDDFVEYIRQKDTWDFR